MTRPASCRAPSIGVSEIRKGFLLAALAVVGIIFSGCGDTVARVNMSDIVDEASEPGEADERPLLQVAVGAIISPETTREYYEDLVRLVADHLGRRAIFSQRRTYAEVNALVENKEVEMAFVCSGPYVEGHASFGMELLVVPKAHGQTVYHSYILVHRDSPIDSLDGLRGKRFAFTDPRSNTGCLVPTYMLAQSGETPETFFGDVFFSQSHDNSIKAVAEGLCDGAAVDSLVWEFMNTIDPTLTSQTRIIEKSSPYGIPPVVVHPALPKELKKELQQALLTLHQDPQGAELMARLQIDQFVKGDDAMYDTVREMQCYVAAKTSSG